MVEIKGSENPFPGTFRSTFLAAFLRLYRIDEYMIFLGDEGRDAIVVKNMVDKWHFPAIGPPTEDSTLYNLVWNLQKMELICFIAEMWVGLNVIYLTILLGKKLWLLSMRSTNGVEVGSQKCLRILFTQEF